MFGYIIEAMETTRTINHGNGHTDTETYLQDTDGVWMWAVTKCNEETMSDTKQATYEFSYAIQRLRDAIDYAQTDGDFQQARIWSNHVEAAYHADMDNANEGLRLMHSVATGGESQLIKSWKDEAIAQEADAQDWKNQVSELRGG
jgi:hypothetical protein